MNFKHYLISGIVLSVILISGVLAFPIQDVFAVEKKSTTTDKPVTKQALKVTVESLKKLKANQKRVLVLYKDDVKPKDVADLVNKGAEIKYEFTGMDGIAIHIDATKLKEIQQDPNVAQIVEDQVVYATLDTSVPIVGASAVHASGITGQGSKVCIVDTGVDDTHPALNPLIAEIDYFANPNDGDAHDDNGHGTHVAGIIASKDPLYRGVAPGASLMAAKVLGPSGSGSLIDVIAGINWCVSNGADVINLSLGYNDANDVPFPNFCDTHQDAIAVTNAVNAGVVVAVASGNDSYIDAISSPGCASNAITVGAVTDSDVRTIFSNEGIQLDVVAPGAPITSLVPGGGFATFQGTSMATPHVAGLAALILDKNSNLSPTQVYDAIKNNALDLIDPNDDEAPGFDTVSGWGRIRALESVNGILYDSASSTSSTGTGIISLSTLNGGILSMSSISESSLPASGKPLTTFPHGFTSWTVSGLTAGQTITVTLTYPANIPVNSKYWKVVGGSWVDATSIVGDNDGDNVLTLTITDNSSFDADPTQGVISDPGGPASPDTDGDGISDDTDPHPSNFDYIAVNSGSWLAPATWQGGSSPGNIGPGIFATINPGVTVTLSTEIDNRGTIINQGTLTIQNPSGTGISTFSGGLVDNSGLLNVANSGGNGMRFGSSTLGTLVNSGTITITNTSPQSGIVVFNVPNGIATNTGTIILANTAGTSISSTGTFTNNPPGVILEKCGAAYVGIPTPTNQCVISIADAPAIPEGNTGDAPVASFTVTLLDQTHPMPISVNFATADNIPPSATAGADYTANSGILTFVPGQFTQTIPVSIIGDVAFEPDETFLVNLSAPSGVTNVVLSDSQGIGTIQNDELPATGVISVNAGGSGTILTMSGANFIPASTITFKLDLVDIGSTTAPSGAFSSPITIPSAAPGIHSLSATDGVNSITIQFHVIAPRIVATQPGSIYATTISGMPSSSVELYLKGFAGNDPSRPITISVDGVSVGAPILANKIGSYKAFPLTVPATFGPHTISASDGTSNIAMTFYVLP